MSLQGPGMAINKNRFVFQANPSPRQAHMSEDICSYIASRYSSVDKKEARTLEPHKVGTSIQII